jgi:hypothetical protein
MSPLCERATGALWGHPRGECRGRRDPPVRAGVWWVVRAQVPGRQVGRLGVLLARRWGTR